MGSSNPPIEGAYGQDGTKLLSHHPGDGADQKNQDEWCTNKHGETGLTAQVLESRTSSEQASIALLQYIKKYVPTAKRALLAGNSVHFDKAFLRKEPYAKVMDYLGYRILDVTAIKEATRRWCDEDILKDIPAKVELHRAKEDILDSIAEAKHYKVAIFQRPR